MSLFGPSKEEKIELDIIERLVGIIDRLTFLEFERYKEQHELTTFVSSITLNKQKTTGIIMATQFKRTEKVTYVIAFTKKDGTPGDIQPGSFSIAADNANVTVVPDGPDLLTGTILGVADGSVSVNWAGTSLAGLAVPGTIALTISDETPPPDTEVVATAITLSDALPQ